MSYINFGSKQIDIDNAKDVVLAYNEGYVATRVSTGHLEQVRSLRVNLEKYTPSSENRRILKKYSHEIRINPIPYPNYSWEIHKLGKDFYESKFGKDVFSANKIKELFNIKSNFNSILTYSTSKDNEFNNIDGYCISLVIDKEFVHYAYPFYKLELINSSFGIYMMTKAISLFKDIGFKYIYLGSVHESSSLYKLQFTGLEWWDKESNKWDGDLDKLKNIVKL